MSFEELKRVYDKHIKPDIADRELAMLFGILLSQLARQADEIKAAILGDSALWTSRRLLAEIDVRLTAEQKTGGEK